ncbi:MAG: hypothetical protein AAF570_24205, partial [Bacteroidota bacterium]
DKIRAFDSNLTFLMGGKEEELELIISAEGIRDHFPAVEALVAAAPKIPGWQVIAFKPPHGTLDFVLEFGDIKLDPKEVWFVGLGTADDPSLIGLRIGFREYEEERKQVFLQATFLLLDIILGEKSTTMDLSYVDVMDLPVLPSEEGWMRMTELREYIDQRKAQV